MEKRMKVCLVTGATGFIGQHMLAELAAAGRKVLALGKPEEVFCTAVLRDAGIRTAAAFPVSAAVFAKSDVQFCFGDVADGKFIESVFAAAEKGGMDIEFVLHFAACATIQKAQENEREAWRTNYDGTRNVLAAALRRWQRHDSSFRGFFYASTDKVYGEGSRSSYHESDELRPLSCPYDASKARADELVRSIARKSGFPAVVYRFCNVYGPGDYHKSRVVPGTLYRLLYTQTAPVLKKYRTPSGGAESFYRDMIYVRDLTRAVAMLLDRLERGGSLGRILGEAFNLGTSNSYAMGEVIGRLSEYAGRKIAPREEIVTAGEIKNQCMDYGKLNRELGYAPRYTLEKGLKETAAWYIDHKEEIDGHFV